MRPRSIYSNCHELKKMSYRILDHLHDLEKKKSRLQVLGCKVQKSKEEIHCLSVLFQKLIKTIRNTFINLSDDYLKTLVDEHINKLIYLSKRVEANYQSSHTLRKGYLSKTLSSHTETFNKLIESSPNINIDLDSWSDTLSIAVKIWGNDI